MLTNRTKEVIDKMARNSKRASAVKWLAERAAEEEIALMFIEAVREEMGWTNVELVSKVLSQK